MSQDKNTEDALEKYGVHNSLLQKVLEVLPVGVWIIDRDGKVVHGNPASQCIWKGARFVGIEQYGEYKGWRLDTGQKIEPAEWAAARAIQQGETTIDEEVEIECFDGTRKIILHAAVPVKNEQQEIIGAIVVNQDITERKKAEKTLIEQSRILEAFFSNTITPLVILDRNFNFIRVNEAYAKADQRDVSEFPGHNHFEFYPSDARLIFERVVETKKHYQTLARPFVFPDHPEWGVTYWDWTLTPLLDNRNEVEFLVFSLEDVTDRKKAEDALREKERHAQSLLRVSKRLELANTYDEVLNAARDEVKIIIGYQDLWAYLFTEDKKYARALVAGGPMAETVMSEEGVATLTIQGDRMLEEIAEAKDIVVVEDARTDERTNKEIVSRLQNRTIINVPIILMDRHLGSIGTGTFGEEGVRVPSESEQKYLSALASHMAVTFDRIHLQTERRRAEEALGRLNEELEQRVKARTEELENANIRLKELDRMKSMFIASMSHELRTPLNSIIGFSSILLNEWTGPVNAEQKENLSTVLRSGRHLLNLINDVIDVSKIEAGKIDSVIEKFDLHDVIEEAVNFFTKEINEKRLSLTVEVMHQEMHTDRRRLLQCVLNLLSNAVKFTDKGSVSVQARLWGRDWGAGDFIEISVADTGIGIREEDCPKLFNAFVRLDSPLRASIPGTGLGLYLSKKLAAEVLKGDILLSSRYGEGSTFTIVVPVMIDEKSPGNRR
jgi:PAS domain S-box-containing protein